MKKLLSILLSGAMALSLAACSSGRKRATTAADKAAETAASVAGKDDVKGASEAADPAADAAWDLNAADSANSDKLLDGVKVVYIANECASDWQAVSTEYLKALVNAQGGDCRIYNPENDASKTGTDGGRCPVLKPPMHWS